jgi:GT2 family glycosyltransferase
MPDASIHIAVVMACFNRRETTLRCLRSLMAQQSPALRISVHLLDDNSQDGTAQAVREQFPQVNLLAGDGNRFWGGGMFMAMGAAAGAPFDYLLWLNDDVTLKADALARLLDAAAAIAASEPSNLNIIVGAMESAGEGGLSYGGFMRRSWWAPSKLTRVGPHPDSVRRIDTLNGNCVLVSAAVVERIGLIDPTFVHQLGDIDYGYRLARAGGQVWLAPGYVGLCDNNPGGAPWLKAGARIGDRLKVLSSPRGLPIRPWVVFGWRHGGIVGLGSVASMYLMALWRIVSRSSREVTAGAIGRLAPK